jgi:uncharacterized protein
MREQLLKLCELQKLDIEIDKRQKALAALDDGETTKAEIEGLTERFGENKKKREKVETEHFDKDLELKTVEAKKKKDEDLMFSGKVSNLKELKDLQKESEACGREIDRLSTRALELMDELETAKKEERESKSTLEATQAKLAEILESYEKNGAQTKVEIAELKEQRKTMTPEIPPALLERYKKMQARQGVVVVSEVDDNVCAACHTAVPNHLLTAVRSSKAIQLCDSCGRILVWTGLED